MIGLEDIIFFPHEWQNTAAQIQGLFVGDDENDSDDDDIMLIGNGDLVTLLC